MSVIIVLDTKELLQLSQKSYYKNVSYLISQLVPTQYKSKKGCGLEFSLSTYKTPEILIISMVMMRLHIKAYRFVTKVIKPSYLNELYKRRSFQLNIVALHSNIINKHTKFTCSSTTARQTRNLLKLRISLYNFYIPYWYPLQSTVWVYYCLYLPCFNISSKHSRNSHNRNM